MKPLSPATNVGRTIAGDDVNHRTADDTRRAAARAAKALRHAARQEGHEQERQVDDVVDSPTID